MRKSIVFAMATLILSVAFSVSVQADDLGNSGLKITDLTFSTDGGKTWSADFPILKKGNPVFKVKVVWTASETPPILWGAVMSRIVSKEKDFASAKKGLREIDSNNGMKLRGWYQNASHGRSLKSPRPFIYTVDLGVREKGTMGKQNFLDKEKRRSVDGPLAEIPAHAPGTYRFFIGVTYRLKDGHKPFLAEEAFDVSIEE
jgi:hypothetical protein